MRTWAENERIEWMSSSSGGRQGVHSLHVPAMVTRLHSPWTLSRPRSRNWRKPITDLMIPNTGSGICLRKA